MKAWKVVIVGAPVSGDAFDDPVWRAGAQPCGAAALDGNPRNRQG